MNLKYYIYHTRLCTLLTMYTTQVYEPEMRSSSLGRGPTQLFILDQAILSLLIIALYPIPYILNPTPHTPSLDPQPEIFNPQPQTSDPTPQTPDPKPPTLNPQPKTPNPKP